MTSSRRRILSVSTYELLVDPLVVVITMTELWDACSKAQAFLPVQQPAFTMSSQGALDAAWRVLVARRRCTSTALCAPPCSIFRSQTSDHIAPTSTVRRESWNHSLGKRSLSSPTPLLKQIPAAGWAGRHPGGSWISPGEETLQTIWAVRSSAEA